MIREEHAMNSKAAIFSAIAILGTALLLWAGYQGIDSNQRGHEEDEETEQVEEQQAVDEHDAVLAIKQRGDILSLDQILGKADGQHAGRILESELKRKDGHYVYEVEVVDEQGRVREIEFDAGTGEVLKQKQGD
jgi:uncharacterized membrane protein YkoI